MHRYVDVGRRDGGVKINKVTAFGSMGCDLVVNSAEEKRKKGIVFAH
jgi:hypothetical protein